MQFKNLLLLSGMVMFFTACNGATKQESITLEKVGNYPDITWIKGKMILSKDDKSLFVVNQNRPNKIDILDLRDLSKPKLFKEIICSKNSKDRILDYKITDNKKYLFVSISDKVIIYNIEDLNSIHAINEITLYSAESLAITSNDKYLYVSGSKVDNFSSYIHSYNIQNLKNIIYLSKYEQDGSKLTISPNGKRLIYAISTSEKERLGIADISNPKEIKLLDKTGKIFNNRGNFATSARIEDMLFSNDSKRLYIAGNEVGLMVYDISKNKLTNIQLTAGKHTDMLFNTTDSIYSISLNKEKNILYLSGVLNKNIKFIDSIKGINSAVLLEGKSIQLSNNGDFVVQEKSNGLNFYLVRKNK